MWPESPRAINSQEHLTAASRVLTSPVALICRLIGFGKPVRNWCNSSWSQTTFSTFCIPQSSNSFRSCTKTDTGSVGCNFHRWNSFFQQHKCSRVHCIISFSFATTKSSCSSPLSPSQIASASPSSNVGDLTAFVASFHWLSQTIWTIQSRPHSRTLSGYWCVLPLRLLQQATILCYQCNRQLFLEKCLNFNISGIEHGVFIGTIRESSRTDILMQVLIEGFRTIVSYSPNTVCMGLLHGVWNL